MDMNNNNIVFTLSASANPVASTLFDRQVYLSEDAAFAAQRDLVEDTADFVPVRATFVRPSDWVVDYASTGADYIADVAFHERENSDEYAYRATNGGEG